MEPHVTQVPQKLFFTSVTPFSKVFALILFITLPLVTLYIGYVQGQKAKPIVSETQSLDENSQTIPEYVTYTDAECGIDFAIPRDWSLLQEDTFGNRTIVAGNYEFVGAQSVGDADNIRGSAIYVNCEKNDNFTDPQKYIEFEESSRISNTLRRYQVTLENNPALVTHFLSPQSIEEAKNVRGIILTTSYDSRLYYIKIVSTDLDDRALAEIEEQIVRSFDFN